MEFLSTPAWNSKWYKASIIGLLFLLLFFLGTLQDVYVVNLFDGSKSLLISRHVSTPYLYPLNTEYLLKSIVIDPRWISFMIYTAGFFLLTLGIIYFLFKDKAYTKYVFFVFGSMILFSLLLAILSFITGSYESGYRLAQNLKGIYQSPLITFILITFLYFLDQQKKGKEDFIDD